MSHLFVAHADLTRLSCDAWLLPSDCSMHVMDHWIPDDIRARFQQLNSRNYRADLECDESWGNESTRVRRVDDWPGRSQAFLTNVGGTETHEVDWYLKALREFVDKAHTVPTRRERPLLAIPAVGTGFGGHWAKKATLIDALVRESMNLAEHHQVDIVFVAFDAPTFAAAQKSRQTLLEAGRDPWGELPEHLLEHTRSLGMRARRGELVLFLGAGVSAGAGLPLWGELLEKLARRAGLDDEEVEALGQLDSMDRGLIVERKLGGRVELEEAIRAELTSPCHSLSHALLAGLPTESVVTLNYDRLFEMASEVVTGEITVLPAERGSGGDRWLLKLHGCIKNGGLILTREDYLRFGDRRAALAGIVQALLFTRHMLFVGFGLTDLNFLRILDDVRKAMGDERHDRELDTAFGTVLNLRPNPLKDSIWSEDLNILSVSHEKEASLEHGARYLEIFLDRLLFEAGTSPAYLMDKTFDATLNDAQKKFRDELKRIRARYAHELEGTPEWLEFERMLRGFGAPD